MEIRRALEAYRPFNEQEERDRQAMLAAMAAHEDIFLRSCAFFHMTASAWIVNARRDRALMAWHNIYRSWSWLGGHADGEEDLLSVALREAREESGLVHVRPASEDIFSLEILTVDGHEKRESTCIPTCTSTLPTSSKRTRRTNCATSPTRTAALTGFPSTRRWPPPWSRGCKGGSMKNSTPNCARVGEMSRLFRMATEADAQALLAIYAPYTRGTASFEDGPPALEEFAARIRDISAVYPYIVCEVDGEIAGYAYAHLYKERAAYRWNVEVTIYLSPAFHRRGIGRALMQRLLEMLRRQGVRMAYSCITLPNPASTGLHAAMGFAEAGVLTDAGWKNGQWRDVVWMQKRLNESTDAPREVVPIGNIDVRDLLGSD